MKNSCFPKKILSLSGSENVEAGSMFNISFSVLFWEKKKKNGSQDLLCKKMVVKVTLPQFIGSWWA